MMSSTSKQIAKNDDTETLLAVKDLKKYFDDKNDIIDRILKTEVKPVRAVDGVSFEIYSGETLGLVGESGCGKSTVGKTILRLHEATDGQVLFSGDNIFDMNKAELKAYRRHSQLVFQEPFDSINPRMTIRDCLSEPLEVHNIGSKKEREQRIKTLLGDVGLSEEYVDRYVHEFSGGQCQRIAIARALAVQPDLIVLDEPVSALDVSVQAQILNLLNDLQDEFNVTFLFISHNLSAIQHLCDRVAVMYLGKICEIAPVEKIFTDPSHPYTEALLDNISRADPDEKNRARNTLVGDVPSPRDPPTGCRFRTRCPKIIPPEGMNIEQDYWRNIMDFRQRLESKSITVEQIEKSFELDQSTTQSWGDLNREQQIMYVKDRYDLPIDPQDARVYEVLTTACGQVCDGLYNDAKQLICKVFVSPCEENEPPRVSNNEENTSYCHLNSGEFDG